MKTMTDYHSETTENLIRSDIERSEAIIDLQKEKLLSILNGMPDSLWIDAIPTINQWKRQGLTSTIRYPNITDPMIVDSNDEEMFLSLIDIDCLETGYTSRAELYVNVLCREKGEQYTLQLMNDVYTHNPKDELVLCSVINILSHIDYEKLGSFAITLCIGMIAVGTPLVWEYVINACDRWGRKEFIPCLESIKTDSVLLKRMLRKVINRLQKEEDDSTCLSVV